jgi:hypothetical protein
MENVQEAYIANITVDPCTVRISNKTSEARYSRIADATPIKSTSRIADVVFDLSQPQVQSKTKVQNTYNFFFSYIAVF